MREFFHGYGKDIVFLVIGLIGGGLIGWSTSAHFASAAKFEEVKLALAEARDQGLAQGAKEAQKQFDSMKEDELKSAFPSVFEQIANSSEAVGYSEGYEAGTIKGYEKGIAEGRTAAVDAIGRFEAATRDWGNYQGLVEAVAELARQLEGNVGDAGLESQMVAWATALVEAAKVLKSSHLAQAESFNSITDQLARAVESRNFPEIRRLSIALSEAMPIKEANYLQNEKLKLQEFEGLSGQ